VTVSPLPGSRDASPRTQISFLGVPASALTALSVRGSRSGAHVGRLAAYSQGDGASFLPARPFLEGERVSVRLSLRSGGQARRLAFSFAVAREDAISTTPETGHRPSPRAVQSFRSRPDLHPPTVAVSASSPAVAAGEVLLAPYSDAGQGGPMILDQRGGLVWFKPLAPHVSAANLQVQSLWGRPVLTWWQGDITVHGFGLGEDLIADGTYTDVARVRAGNGLRADLHDFQLTPEGTALITAYHSIACDLSSIRGPRRGTVVDGVLQEIDIRTGLVMFQWSGLDHVALSESYSHPSGGDPDKPFDFFHLNSIDLIRDGSLLLSARNTWGVYDVDALSGQIVWRLGGKRSSFALGPGTGTAWQHDPRELAGGEISIFDNGASPRVHGQSRGIVVSIDSQRRAATLVSQLTHTGPLVAESQGNMQALSDGDWFVGWGQVPDFSEFDASGQLLFDAHLPPGEQSYRAFRFPWTGAPSHRPALALASGAGGASTAYASWNGATGIAAWRVLAGSAPGGQQVVAQAPRGGFETAFPLPSSAGPYVTAQALGADGNVLGTTPTARRG
jgi:Arylsulfotransferase (ASST)